MMSNKQVAITPKPRLGLALGLAFLLQWAFCAWVASQGGYRAIPVEVFGLCQILPGAIALIFAGQYRRQLLMRCVQGKKSLAMVCGLWVAGAVWLCTQVAILNGAGTLLTSEQAMAVYPLRHNVPAWMWQGSLYFWFLLCVAPLMHALNAAAEEIMWRGYLIDELAQRWGVRRAEVLSAVIWGAWHIPMVVLLNWAFPGQAIEGALMFTLGLSIWGYSLARLRRMSGGLLVPVVMHAMFNAWMLGHFNLLVQESAAWLYSPWGPLGWLLGATTAGAIYHLRPDVMAEQVTPFVETPASKYVVLRSGVRVHYTDTGGQGAQTVVLLHGFMASLRDFDAWVPLLSLHHRVVRVDLPGMGLTAGSPSIRLDEEFVSQCLLELLDQLGVDQASLVGHSRGGYAAWTFAVMHPERVNKLALIASAGLDQGREPRRVPLSFKLAEYPWLKPVLRYVAARWLVRMTLSGLVQDSTHVTTEWVERAYRLTRLQGNRSTFLRLRPFRDRPDLQARLPGIQVPTYIAWGSDDYLIPVRHAHLFQSLMPHAVLKVYIGVGHYAIVEAGAILASDVGDFLKPVKESRCA